jgi:hypothetical protein
MTRWIHPPELDRQRDLDRFEPAVEGARRGLSREVSLAIWERLRADATDSAGRCDEELARQQFDELAARIAACSGRVQPEPGRLTRAGTETDRGSRAAWSSDEWRLRAPGRETLVEVEARPRTMHPSIPGRQTVGDDAASARPGFDDYRVLGLEALLQQQLAGRSHALRRDVVAAAASADRSIAGRATRWLEQLPGATTQTPDGHALWQAAERHAATLYRRAASSGLVDPQDPAVASALQQRGTGQLLALELRRAMERELGVELAGVRVHTDAVAARAAHVLGADAFTLGEDIFFAEGTFAPDTRSGRQLLVHELTHVAQSLRGRASPAGDGLQVSQPGEPLEQEADAVAARVDAVALDGTPGATSPVSSETSTGSDVGARIGEAERDESAYEANQIQRVAGAGVSGAGGPLPHLAAIQRSFGPRHDVSGVAAHVGGAAAQAADSLGAQAYASGGAVAFAAAPDLHLAAHEAAHVVQQRAGIQLSRSMGEVGDVHERHADAVADRVVAGQSAADLLPEPGGATARASVQRRIQLGGTMLDRAAVSRTTDDLVRVRLRDLTGRPAQESLVRETVRELDQSSDTHTFGTIDALAANVRQRVLTSQYMRRSQGTTPHSMAFSYPDSRLDGTVGVGPKVNAAAVTYWGPVQGSPYFFDLTPAGRADAYQAIMALFVEHTEPRRRSLLHCDYVVSIIRARSYAETIGSVEFNRLVSTGALRLQLRYDMFSVMEAAQGAGGRTPPLQNVTVASEHDLIVGDHVVFWNHPSYDPLIEGTHGVWRLENAIVIDRHGGELRYQGHGYFSPVNKAHLIRGMLHHYNTHVDEALAITRRIDHGTAAARAAAQAELSTRFPRVFRRAVGGGWEIRGVGFESVPTVRELKHLTAAEAPGLVSPISHQIDVRRPVETDL